MAGLATTLGSGAMTNSIEDIRHADVIFIFGSNTTEQHPMVAERVMAAKASGKATLIVADPRRTPVAALADIHLRLTPGTDLLLITALCKIILDEGLENKTFIEARTEGFEALYDYLHRFSLEDAVQATGIPLESLHKAARAYARGPDSSILYCMGITQHTTGTANCRALVNLTLLCGMVGRPHVGLNPLRGQNNVQGACDMGALPDVLTAYAPAGSAVSAERFTPVWGDFANTPGLTLTEMMTPQEGSGLRGLFIMGENPIVSDPDATHARHVLEHMEFLVVQDIFMTETAQCAHVVLPAASWLEKEGTFTNTERRVQKVNTVLPPLPGTLPDWLILTRLLQALGHNVEYSCPEDIFNEIRQVTPSYHGITYQRIEAAQGLCWPCPHEDHPGTSCLHQGVFTRGKGLFTAEPLGATHEEPDTDYPLRLTTGRVGFQYHTGTMTRRSWGLDRECPENFLEIHPEDAKPLGLWENKRVRVRSRRGSVEALARITDTILPGVVFMPFHFASNPANTLTSPLVDPVAKIPSFKVCAVRIEDI